MKEFKTYEEQLELLISRGCKIDDKTKAIKILKSISYYRLTAYFIPFKNQDGTYKGNITLEKVYNIYKFDEELRQLLFSYLEEIEIFARTNIAYEFGKRYGALGYLDENNFNKYHKHDKFINNFKRELLYNKNIPFVTHHQENYGGKFPIWVAFEMFTFGDVSKFYADMMTQEKKRLARKVYNNTYKNTQNHFLLVSKLRNYCAHYQRLYYQKFATELKNSPPEIDHNNSRRLISQIYAMRNLYHDKDKWNHVFLDDLSRLIKKYDNDIHLHHIGFSVNWRTILTK